MTALPNELLDLIQNSFDELLLTFGDFKAEKKGDSLSGSRCAIIGFAGQKIKGSITLNTVDEFLTASHPNNMMGMEVDKEDLPDWLGEMANQLLGRFKNMMLKRNVDFGITPPTIVAGRDISTSEKKNTHMLNFTVNGQFKLSIGVEALIHEEINFSEEKDQEKDVEEEGSTLFF